ncbi:hypothetical protein [Falsiroseomonas stagni]|uniref:hypothetical protein n=1 Tax=Falsiroseomonas stagni TaxID=484882 RepID=UPI001FEA314B|nr:hypothetical protein [Falsiroseomonas stagni]
MPGTPSSTIQAASPPSPPATTHRSTVEGVGIRYFSRQDLENAAASGERLQIRVLGLASIASDVTADLARAAIDSVTVFGALQASAEVKAALADRMI